MPVNISCFTALTSRNAFYTVYYNLPCFLATGSPTDSTDINEFMANIQVLSQGQPYF